ncbi:Rossmann-like and DUF2520 domain-containing protein [Flavobacterium sp. NKUCC04_CG]|uniref:Rossmann-like and DUF2520 domain-containing protein n=1 Tax=Flavobacterium sp. NKUCC04_CG TaxID=2842121 RepID=UPI001C5AEA95|nr:Rossmann-like and DUF2520 domain-containing protein [Flavobacterium sp. NKUCC04_CG]MBW3517980.1 DUF2520 domain-containing protein [Flavobacterium sp. NKUCC04_CG]
MITVSIIGSGKVAHHLILHLLDQEGVLLQQVYARSTKNLPAYLPKDKIINEIDELVAVDLVLLAVSDDAIEEVSAAIKLPNQLIAHTSGGSSINAIKGTARAGVFYMLQTFSLEKAVDFSKIPFCLEASNDTDFALLEKLALKFSEKVFNINSEQRKSIHVAAVFVSNFVNHMYVLGSEICKENQVPFDILKPLILETAEKIQTLSPQKAQTGPAVRKDKKTIKKHLDFLVDSNLKEIYQMITQSIQLK